MTKLNVKEIVAGKVKTLKGVNVKLPLPTLPNLSKFSLPSFSKKNEPKLTFVERKQKIAEDDLKLVEMQDEIGGMNEELSELNEKEAQQMEVFREIEKVYLAEKEKLEAAQKETKDKEKEINTAKKVFQKKVLAHDALLQLHNAEVAKIESYKRRMQGGYGVDENQLVTEITSRMSNLYITELGFGKAKVNQNAIVLLEEKAKDGSMEEKLQYLIHFKGEDYIFETPYQSSPDSASKLEVFRTLDRIGKGIEEEVYNEKTKETETHRKIEWFDLVDSPVTEEEIKFLEQDVIRELILLEQGYFDFQEEQRKDNVG